ncbi:hypothetical protein BG452_38755 [Streptomyces sp. CBMA123]|nr:hypothetical protein [Streptomyces sp. CBMA123]
MNGSLRCPPRAHPPHGRPATGPALPDGSLCGEREAGSIEGSLHIALAELPARLDEIPVDRPVVVHCAGGHRSSIAASLLRHHGHPDVSDLLGGYAAWHTLTHPARP